MSKAKLGLDNHFSNEKDPNFEVLVDLEDICLVAIDPSLKGKLPEKLQKRMKANLEIFGFHSFIHFFFLLLFFFNLLTYFTLLIY